MGKSSTGKDTVYSRLLQRQEGRLQRVVPYTTRPIRLGEEEGKEYHFTDDEGYEKLNAQGKVIESRAYQTYYGVWRYFTVDDGQIGGQHFNFASRHIGVDVFRVTRTHGARNLDAELITQFGGQL